jgi:selenocysteine lyase/cysteine desulfurase
MSPAEVALALDEEFNIMSRPGLQCAPAAHHTTGTFPGGTVRLSPGYFLEKEDVEKCIVALEALAYRGKEPHS